MKTLVAFFFLCLVPTGGWAAPARSCPNRTVTVVADRHHAEDIRQLFMMMSSLPYEVTFPDGDSKIVAIAISYRRLDPGDDFSEPLSLELGERVRLILTSYFTPYGVLKISAEFDPTLDC